jgi:ketosteroid isomerase-like protein
MAETPSTLVAYYAAVDSGDLAAAMAFMEPDVDFVMHLPNGTKRDRGHEGLLRYLSGRGDVDRRHVPARVAVEGDVEFVHGSVVEDGVTTTGYFVGAVAKSSAGLIRRYQVVFDLEYSLIADS